MLWHIKTALEAMLLFLVCFIAFVLLLVGMHYLGVIFGA